MVRFSYYVPCRIAPRIATRKLDFNIYSVSSVLFIRRDWAESKVFPFLYKYEFDDKIGQVEL